VTQVSMTSSQVRAQLGHPVIDGDGHFVELAPLVDEALLSHLEAVGGRELRDRYLGERDLAGRAAPFDTTSVLAGRDADDVRRQWRAMPSWWGWQTRNTLDRATAHLPKLLYERLDEMGIDLTILYPSTTLGLLDLGDGELGGAAAHGVNTWLAETFAPFRDRMIVGGLVPMTTPDIAIAELEHAVALGFKSVVITGYARRSLGAASPGGAEPYRLDTFGIDSDYDYDPFWAKCVELGVAPVSHSAHQHHRISRSISSYVYNHIGGLATSHESMAKSLFLGGVTRRFPELRVGFLEGGVAWACSLYSDLIGHWEKRNASSILDLDPDRLDVDGVLDYLQRYGNAEALAHADEIRAYLSRPAARPAQLDEFAAAGIEKAEDIKDLFVPRFYFGCEADDPLVAWAFAEKVNPFGARLRPIFGSDISHWDVVDMTEPVEESWELVERGTITEADFREFTYLNAVRLHGGMNPNFYEGTIVQDAVAATLAEGID
jgi:predicted TIM-barrel fold metal-dependent hydrolase